MIESPFNPFAPALANAIRDATGARLTATPFAPDRIYRAIMDRENTARIAIRGGGGGQQ